VITGQFSVEEASDLSLVLRSGSLPISLQTEGNHRRRPHAGPRRG
jgi:preprotein translocase subunit SecD